MQTVTFTLDGVSYTAPRLNIGQMRRLTTAVTEGAKGNELDALAVILPIILERADPKAPALEEIGFDVNEWRNVLEVVMAASGLKAPENPPSDAS